MSIMMPPAIGITPPLRPLAPPRATIASRSRMATLTIAATSAPDWRPHDHRGQRPIEVAIVLVDEQILVAVKDAIRPDDLA